MTSAPALLWRLLKYTRPYRRLVLLALLAWGIVIALDATIPQLIARAIDIGIDAGDAARLTLFAALAAGAYLVRAVFVFLHVSVYRYWDHRIGRDLRDGYYRKLMHLDYGYFDRANTGDLITRGISDVDVMREWNGLGVAEMVSTLEWECFREGYDDLRYLTTLEQAIAKAEKRHPEHAAVRQARVLIKTYWDADPRVPVQAEKLTAEDYAQRRRDMTAAIEALQELAR